MDDPTYAPGDDLGRWAVELYRAVAANDGTEVLELTNRLEPGEQAVQGLVAVAMLGLGWAQQANPRHDMAAILDAVMLLYEARGAPRRDRRRDEEEEP